MLGGDSVPAELLDTLDKHNCSRGDALSYPADRLWRARNVAAFARERLGEPWDSGVFVVAWKDTTAGSRGLRAYRFRSSELRGAEGRRRAS